MIDLNIVRITGKLEKEIPYFGDCHTIKEKEKKVFANTELLIPKEKQPFSSLFNKQIQMRISSK